MNDNVNDQDYNNINNSGRSIGWGSQVDMCPRPTMNHIIRDRTAKVINFYTQFLILNTQFLVFNAQFLVFNSQFIIFTHVLAERAWKTAETCLPYLRITK